MSNFRITRPLIYHKKSVFTQVVSARAIEFSGIVIDNWKQAVW